VLVAALGIDGQQRERVRRVGMLNTFAAEDPEGQARIAALLQALQPLGWTVATNLRLDHRWGTRDRLLCYPPPRHFE